MMHWLRFRTLLVLTLTTVLWVGCGGGSGSSGFDLRAQEETAITTVLNERRCVALPETAQVICPLGTEVPASPATDVVVRTVSGLSLSCARGGSGCTLRMTLEVEGLGDGMPATSVVAVRRAGRAEPWRLLAPDQRLGAGEAVDVTLALPEAEVRAPDGALELEVALLLFGEPPAPLPNPVETLAATGARAIFVSKVRGAMVDRPPVVPFG